MAPQRSGLFKSGLPEKHELLRLIGRLVGRLAVSWSESSVVIFGTFGEGGEVKCEEDDAEEKRCEDRREGKIIGIVSRTSAN